MRYRPFLLTSTPCARAALINPSSTSSLSAIVCFSFCSLSCSYRLVSVCYITNAGKHPLGM